MWRERLFFGTKSTAKIFSRSPSQMVRKFLLVPLLKLLTKFERESKLVAFYRDIWELERPSKARQRKRDARNSPRDPSGAAAVGGGSSSAAAANDRGTDEGEGPQNSRLSSVDRLEVLHWLGWVYILCRLAP